MTFRLTQAGGSAVDFSYTPALKRFYYFAEHLKDGMTVEVKVGPNGRHDIWGLKLEAETLMTPETAREARRADGWWGLALFVGFMISAGWTDVKYQSGARRASEECGDCNLTLCSSGR